MVATCIDILFCKKKYFVFCYLNFENFIRKLPGCWPHPPKLRHKTPPTMTSSARKTTRARWIDCDVIKRMCDDVWVILFSSAILIFSTTLVLKLFCFMIHIEFIFVEMKLCDLPFIFLFVFLYTFCFFIICFGLWEVYVLLLQ